MRRILTALLLAAGLVCTACAPQAPASAATPVSAEPAATPAPTPPFSVRSEPLEIAAPDGGIIGGLLYRPEGLERPPLVLCAPGLGADWHSLAPWAEELCRQGAAAFCFDFRGTGSSLSSGEAGDMSVLTEAEDLAALLNADWDGIDQDRIVLLGESQGGFAAAVAAGRSERKPAALVLLYPAFVIPDAIRMLFPEPEDIPSVFNFLGTTLGHRYGADVHGYDALGEIADFTGPVLILHGTEDTIVPMAYSEQAQRLYADARLEKLTGAGHGFWAEDAETALDLTVDFLRDVQVLRAASPTE